MRVVAGSAGGIPLRAPRTDARPTMDRVKSAIFSSLGARVPGARVLDLFAGSGSLGIEALSRGARSALFIESDPLAADCVRRNLEATRLVGVIRKMDVFRFIGQPSADGFDLIFADPPYPKRPDDPDHAAALVASADLPRWLAADGLFVLERSAGKAPPNLESWTCVRHKRYGSTEVLFLSVASELMVDC